MMKDEITFLCRFTSLQALWTLLAWKAFEGRFGPDYIGTIFLKELCALAIAIILVALAGMVFAMVVMAVYVYVRERL